MPAPPTEPTRRRAGDWFPFSVGEIEFALAVGGFLVTSLALVGVPAETLAIGTGLFLLVTYLAGMLVYNRRGLRVFHFVEDGGVRGGGYVPYFRGARYSLFLTHTDDDAPSDELLGLYRTLLAKDVQLRRVTFLRPKTESVRWLAEFGEHPNLEQRVVPPERADLLPLSFAVVDESVVVVSVPGYSAIDASQYATRFVLRHLIVIHDLAVARVFLEMHRQLWDRALPLQTQGKKVPTQDQGIQTYQRLRSDGVTAEVQTNACGRDTAPSVGVFDGCARRVTDLRYPGGGSFCFRTTFFASTIAVSALSCSCRF